MMRGRTDFRRTWLAALVLAALVLGAPAGAGAVEAGDAAPDFSIPRLGAGKPLQLSAYRGKVVYLDFWASWCAPCLVSLPMLDDLRKEFPSDQFQVLAVNLDTEPAKAQSFLAKRPVGYPSASDPQGRVPQSFGLSTMPTSYLIDRKGVVRYVHAGFRKDDIDEIRAKVRELVEGGR